MIVQKRNSERPVMVFCVSTVDHYSLYRVPLFL